MLEEALQLFYGCSYSPLLSDNDPHKNIRSLCSTIDVNGYRRLFYVVFGSWRKMLHLAMNASASKSQQILELAANSSPHRTGASQPHNSSFPVFFDPYTDNT